MLEETRSRVSGMEWERGVNCEYNMREEQKKAQASRLESKHESGNSKQIISIL